MTPMVDKLCLGLLHIKFEYGEWGQSSSESDSLSLAPNSISKSGLSAKSKAAENGADTAAGVGFSAGLDGGAAASAGALVGTGAGGGACDGALRGSPAVGGAIPGMGSPGFHPAGMGGSFSSMAARLTGGAAACCACGCGCSEVAATCVAARSSTFSSASCSPAAVKTQARVYSIISFFEGFLRICGSKGSNR